MAGTWGAAFHPDLRVEGPVVRKGSNGEDGYSGFSMRDPVSGETEPTELDDLLRVAGIERVVIAGLATDYCVLATALDARTLGYQTTLLAAAIRAVDLAEGDGARLSTSCGRPARRSKRAEHHPEGAAATPTHVTVPVDTRHGAGRGALDCPP